MAGGIEVLAIQKKLLEGISANCGYTAVLIALIAANSPLGVFAVAIFYAAMQVGANSMQRQMGVPSAIVTSSSGWWWC
jgi:simple sugar transport system permease protein